MTEAVIWNPVERLLWGVTITLMTITIFLFLQKARKSVEMKEKVALNGFVGLLSGLTIERIFRFFADFLIDGNFSTFEFYGDLGILTSLFILFVKIALISYMIGFLIFIFSFELIYRKTKFIITIIQLIIIVIMFFSTYERVEFLFGFVGGFLDTIIYVFIIYQFTKWAHPDFKKVSLVLLCGTLLSGGAYNLSFLKIKSLNIVPLVLPPMIFIFVYSLYIHTFFLEPDEISIIRKISFGLIIAAIIIHIYSVFVFMFEPSFRNSLPITILLFVLEVSITLKMLRFNESETSLDKSSGPNILGSIIKPKKVTEEEVSVSKEKKICLVCKGPVARNNIYLCPECNSLYCAKCSSLLAEQENACWACETPFDESKPIKPMEKTEEDQVVIQEKDLHKKHK